MSDDPKQDHEHKPDNDVEHKHDPGSNTDEHGERESSKTSVPAAMKASTALESLAELQSMLNSIGPSLTVRSGRPLMQFKSRENGTWMFGRSRNVPEEGSLWAFDPRTFTWGWVCFGADKSRPPIDEKLVSVGKPMPDFTKLPDHGFPWTEARGVNMKCVSGIDAGVEVVFKINTIGGVQVIDELIDKVRTQVNRDLAKPPKERDGKVAPFGTLGNDSYPHKDHGKIWIPVMKCRSTVRRRHLLSRRRHRPVLALSQPELPSSRDADALRKGGARTLAPDQGEVGRAATSHDFSQIWRLRCSTPVRLPGSTSKSQLLESI